MIKRAAAEDKHWIMGVLEQDEPINSPIIAQINRFGFEKAFQDVWYYNHQNNIHAIIMRHFNQMHLYETQAAAYSGLDADYEEIASFSSFLGADKIWSGPSTLKALQKFLPSFNLEPAVHMVLEDDKNLIEHQNVELANLNDFKELAAMIFQDPDFKRFYTSEDEIGAGIKRRMELGQCRYFIVRYKGIIAAQAYTTLETEHYVTIGGVLTHESLRQMGFGTKVVSALCQSILQQGKKANLFYHNEYAGRMYKKLGFREAGEYGLLISTS